MLSLALKNILFYKGRSLTTFFLTFIATILFIVYVSMMDGSHDSMLKNALKVYGGGIEIYYKDYRDVGGNEYLIRDVDSIQEQISNIEGYVPSIEGDSGFSCVLFELIKSSSSECISTDEAGLPSFLHIIICQLQNKDYVIISRWLNAKYNT